MTNGERNVLLTDEDIQRIIAKHNEYEIREHGPENALTNELEDYTCNSCIDKYKCDCSFDAYNTGGDCLYDK